MIQMKNKQLRGQELIDAVKKMASEGVQPSDQCRECGYSYFRDDGSEKLDFIEFYSELVEAKTEIDRQNEPDTWETTLSEEDTLLLQTIKESDIECTEELFQEIKDFGISTPEQFMDSYQGCWDSWNGEGEFAENFFLQTGEIDPDNPLYTFIRWSEVWEHHLRYDYTVLDGVYFFSDHF